jgi:hypothetical protein
MDAGRTENTDESGALLHSSCFARGVVVLAGVHTVLTAPIKSLYGR